MIDSAIMLRIQKDSRRKFTKDIQPRLWNCARIHAAEPRRYQDQKQIGALYFDELVYRAHNQRDLGKVGGELIVSDLTGNCRSVENPAIAWARAFGYAVSDEPLPPLTPAEEITVSRKLMAFWLGYARTADRRGRDHARHMRRVGRCRIANAKAAMAA